MTVSHTRPRFLGIGAQRAATTWTYRCLRSHPGLFVPEVKELHFFDEQYGRGLDWYLSQFDAAEPGQIAGEITPNYLYDEEAARRIAEHFPDIRMFVILREPVARARSTYELLHERYAGETFREACKPDGYLVERGLYARHLERLYTLFDKSQIHVSLYDDVQSDPDASLAAICRFIGVPPVDANPAANSTTNSVIFPKTQRVIESLGMSGLIRLAKTEPIGSIVRNGAAKLKARERRRDSDVPREVKDVFRADIERLEKLIDRDLSRWRAPIS